MAETHPEWRFRGRGAVQNPTGRFNHRQTQPIDDGWGSLEQDAPVQLETHLRPESSKAIISSNDSPDLPFNRTINPYQGCEHGCTYCYARPTHAYWNHSPGLEFETEIYYKPDAPRLLEAAFRRPGYQVEPILMGANTDCYQPSERKLELTRKLLQVFLEFRHPLWLITRSNLVLRDLDLLERLAQLNLISAMITVTTLDSKLARSMEPRAPTPERRLAAIRGLSEVGVPVGVMVAPLIPGLTDAHLERVLEAAADAGARRAGYTMIRLPLEVKEIFLGWLQKHHPQRAGKVEQLIRDMRGGVLNQSEFGARMRGSGPYAEMLKKRFELACRRLNLNGREHTQVDCTRFALPPRPGDQLSLFSV